MSTSKKPFVITGKHVLGAMIAFFGVIIVVNVIFVRLAVGSFPGEQVEKSYYQGLNYNETIANRAAQQELGWRLLLVETPVANADGAVEIKLVSKDGDPIIGASISGMLNRPTTAEGLVELNFTSIEEGRYRAEVSGLDVGAWDLSVTVMDNDTEEVKLSAETRVNVL